MSKYLQSIPFEGSIVNAIQQADREKLLLSSNAHRNTYYLALEDDQGTSAGFPHASLETYMIWM